MSQIKSLLYSIFVSRRKRYDPAVYTPDYFLSKEAEPALELCRPWVRHLCPANALDVGFGTGAVLKGLVELGVDARGVEPIQAACDLLPEPYRSRVSLGSALATGAPDHSYDLVLCLDVLEHLPEEQSVPAIRELVRVSRRWVLLNICYWTDTNARKDPTHVNLHSARWWRERIARAGGRAVSFPGDWPNPKSTVLLRTGAD
jgi:SAM-dependent methyltransferase